MMDGRWQAVRRYERSVFRPGTAGHAGWCSFCGKVLAGPERRATWMAVDRWGRTFALCEGHGRSLRIEQTMKAPCVVCGKLTKPRFIQQYMPGGVQGRARSRHLCPHRIPCVNGAALPYGNPTGEGLNGPTASRCQWCRQRGEDREVGGEST